MLSEIGQSPKDNSLPVYFPGEPKGATSWRQKGEEKLSGAARKGNEVMFGVYRAGVLQHRVLEVGCTTECL